MTRPAPPRPGADSGSEKRADYRLGVLSAFLLVAIAGQTPLIGQDPEFPLHRAARTGQAHQVTDLLASGADPNHLDHDRQTPLHHAADAATAQTLIDAGARHDVRDGSGNQPLHTALSEGVASTLIQAGADPGAENWSGETPLHRAVSGGVARALIAAGADVRAISTRGNAPLHFARSQGVPYALLDNSANISATNQIGQSVLHTMWSGGAVRAVIERALQLVESGSDPPLEDLDNSGRTPLHAARNGSVVRTLIEADLNVHQRQRDLFGQWVVWKLNLQLALTGNYGEVPDRFFGWGEAWIHPDSPSDTGVWP